MYLTMTTKYLLLYSVTHLELRLNLRETTGNTTTKK